jgi:hypothetical protein
VLHQDPWHGFSIAHPVGWEVFVFQGQISVREDPVGTVSALIWPFSLQAPGTARNVALQLTALIHSTNPSFQAWQQDNIAPDSNRLTMRTRQTRYGTQVEGNLNVLVDGIHVIVSGFEAPAQNLAQLSPVMTQILASFRTMELMPRQSHLDATEGAFSLQAPLGWMVAGGINRNQVGGAGMVMFNVARDPQRLVSAVMPNLLWTYMDDGMGGFWGGMSGYPNMRFTPAVKYCQGTLAKWITKVQPAVKVESIIDRPDLSDLYVHEWAKTGYVIGSYEVTVALMVTAYVENGIRLKQGSRVITQRPRGQLAGPMVLWTAAQDVYIRAPYAEFETWQPILDGILESFKINPNWQAMENQRIQGQIQNQIAASQADISRRLGQISQTLSETSDIVTNSYWNRQATYDHISEQRSDVMRGVQNVTGPASEVYKVPSGFDQYWMDGLGNFYGGSWMTQPDVHWTPLDPSGQ